MSITVLAEVDAVGNIVLDEHSQKLMHPGASVRITIDELITTRKEERLFALKKLEALCKASVARIASDAPITREFIHEQ